MTSFSDQEKAGRAYFSRSVATSVSGYTLGYLEDEVVGVPVAPVFFYNLGTASTALASGVAFSASGFGTLTASALTITPTGALVTAGVATFDVPRCLAIFCTLSVTGSTFTLRGTDGYGQAITWTGFGASGGVPFSTSGQAITSIAFKTLLTASYTATTATGTATSSVQIGTTDAYGLPYRIASNNRVASVTMDGFPVFATAAAAILGASGFFVQAGFAATGVATASTADPRGIVQLPPNNLANGTRNFAINIISPAFGVTANNDTKENTYGVTPFTN